MKLWKIMGYGSAILCAIMIYITKVLEFPVGYFSGVSGFFMKMFTTIFLVWPSTLTSIIPFSEEGPVQILFFMLYMIYSFGFGAFLGAVIWKLYGEFRPSTIRAAKFMSFNHSGHAYHHKKRTG